MDDEPIRELPPCTPNGRQVGGSHYVELEIQTWDYITRNNIPYLEGCIIKYLTRWRKKGGIEDLRKARHYLEKLIVDVAPPVATVATE